MTHLFTDSTKPAEIVVLMQEYLNAAQPDRVDLQTLENLMRSCRMNVLSHRSKGARLRWNEWFLSLGAMSIRYYEDLTGSSFPHETFLSLLCDRHKAYGVEPLATWGELGIAIRIDSKIARLRNLLKSGDADKGEPIQDTVIDVVGYCVLGYLFHEQEYQKSKGE